MFNPELRYVLFQEVGNDEMMQLIDPNIFVAICVCGTNGLLLGSIVWILYKILVYSGTAAKYIWLALWKSLTPGNEWLDLALIISTVISGIVMIYALNGMSEVLDRGFTKLKNEINKKDERIRELEAKIVSLEGINISGEKENNEKFCKKTL